MNPNNHVFVLHAKPQQTLHNKDEWRDATSFHTHSSSTSFSSVLPNDEEFPELKKNKARIEEEFYRKTPDLINLADEKEFVKKTNCNCKDQNEEYRDRRLSYEAEKQPFLNLKRNSYNKKSISANGAHLTSASSLSSETSVDNLNCNDETKFQIKKHPITEFHKSIDDLFYSEKLDGCFPDKPRRSVSASNGATIDKTFQLTTSKPNEFSNENIASNYFEQDFFIPQSNISHLKKTNENKSGNQKGFTSDLKIEGQENERESGRLVRKVNFNETLEKNESNGTAHDNKTTHIGNIINNAPNFKKTVIVDGGNASIGASKLQNVLPFSCARNRLLASNLPSSAYRDTRKMSLVGKPLIYKNHRTDQRFRRTQSYIHNFLERPRGWKAASYHLAVLVMVLSCLALSVFSTMPEFEEQATIILYYIEIIFVFWLGVEYLCRLWSAGCRSRYRGVYGRLRFATSAYCIIDIIVISASVVVLCMGATGQVFAASAIRGLRFFQILRMLRIDRRAGTWKLLGSVVWAHRQELLTTLYIGFLGLVFSSFLFYLFEKSYNDKYTTFADALWWGVITLSTVGYGDVTPSTGPGKIIGSFCALLGVSFFALPAGILGSGFALKVQQHQRQKHLIRRRVPAARLIQCLWREYCASPESRSVATWKVHLQPPPPIILEESGSSSNGANNSYKTVGKSAAAFSCRNLSLRLRRSMLNRLGRRLSEATLAENEMDEPSQRKNRNGQDRLSLKQTKRQQKRHTSASTRIISSNKFYYEYINSDGTVEEPIKVLDVETPSSLGDDCLKTISSMPARTYMRYRFDLDARHFAAISPTFHQLKRSASDLQMAPPSGDCKLNANIMPDKTARRASSASTLKALDAREKMFRSNVLSANGISAPPVQSGLISRLRQSARRKPINTNTDESADEYLRSNVSASDISTAALQDASVKTLIVPRPVADNISIMSASDISEIESLGALGFSLGSWSKSKHKSSSSNNCYHHHYYQHEHHNHCQSIPTSKRMFGYGGGVGCTSELNADENVSHRHIANSSSLAPPGLRPEAKKTTNFFGVASKLSRPSTSPLPARNRDRDVATNDNESTPQSPLLAMPSSSGKFLKANINIPLKGRTSRSLSLRDSDPAALLIGDFMVAPLHEWAKKMRVQSASATSTSCVNSTMIACATGGGGAADNEYVLGSSATGVHGVVGGNAFLASDDNIMDSSSQLGADEETPPFVLRAIDNYTPQIKNVVRAVRRMQLILARRKFKEALKPYDVKDVIEQYSAGHVDLQARVKKVQEKLDEIVGGKRSNKESSGDVLKVTLANRVIKVERQVEKIDKKIDLLVEMFLEEKRIRLIANNTTAISTAAATTVISGTEFAASFSAPPGSSLSSAGNICVQCAIQQQKQNSHLREFNTQNSGSFVTGHPANQKINIARDGRNHKILHSSISLSQRPASNIVSGCDLHTRRHKIHEAQKNNQNIPIRLNSQTDNDKHNHQRQERIDGNKMIPSPLIFSSLTQRVSPVLANKNNDKEEFMVLKSDEKNFETGFNIRKRNFSSESDSILSQYENKLLLEDQDFAKEKKTYFEHINVEKEKISEAKFAVENEKIGDNNTEETIRLIAAETINNVKRLEDDKSETPLLDQSKSKTIQIHPNDSMA